MTDKTRADFEVWFNSKRGAGMLSKLPPNTGGYEWVTTSEAWEVWQAATALERERCAKVCESLHYTDTSTAQNCADAIRQGGDV